MLGRKQNRLIDQFEDIASQLAHAGVLAVDQLNSPDADNLPRIYSFLKERINTVTLATDFNAFLASTQQTWASREQANLRTSKPAYPEPWLSDHTVILRNLFLDKINTLRWNERIRVRNTMTKSAGKGTSSSAQLCNFLRGLTRMEKAAYREIFTMLMRSGINTSDPTFTSWLSKRFVNGSASSSDWTITRASKVSRPAYRFGASGDGRKVSSESLSSFVSYVAAIARLLNPYSYNYTLEGSPLQILHHEAMSLSSTYITAEWQEPKK